MTPQGAVLDYWFGPLENGFPSEDRSKLWYGGGTAVDAEITDRFADLVSQAKSHSLDHWKETPEGRLALIILLDQFTRNIYRKQKEAFASDNYALSLAKEGIDNGHDLLLQPIQRIFFYHPLEHSESLSDQEKCIELFLKLKSSLPEQQKQKLAGFITYAQKHRDIIARFGRFPHRNAILGRESTPEEKEYLSKAERFGQ